MRRVAALLALLPLVASCSYTTRDVLPPIPESVESSKIFASDGTLLHTFHAEENRTIVPLRDIPTHLQDAVIAIEDERFYRHNGVDLRAVLRAAQANAAAGEIAQGGSTITQQYVKTVLLRNDEQTIQRKIEEAALAIQMEQKYTKERILELYLNTIYFGNGAYGVEAAARQYFGKPVGKLGLAESALLAGLIQAPGRFDPYDEPKPAIRRRNVVLRRMGELGVASERETERAARQPLRLASEVIPAAERYQAPFFIEEVKRWILGDERFGSTGRERRDLLFGGGLRIQTTVDLGMQHLAEQAVREVLPDPASYPDAAVVAIEPGTGYVRAMVGGRDFFGSTDIAKLNLATQGRRQAGSSFKPFVLAAALEQGTPINSMWTAPASIEISRGEGADPWRVSNYGGGAGGTVTLGEATVRSYNTTYAQLIMEIGPERAVEAATKYGVRSPLEPWPSAVLGSNDVTAMDMASAYGTFANRGVRVPPVLVTRITRSDGTVLYAHDHTQDKVLDTSVADTVTSVLHDAVQGGTGTAAQIPGREVAGKTGTAQQWRDAWFVGYTPQLVASVWVGFPHGQVSMAPPVTPIQVTGGSWPAEIWRRFMAPALEGLPVEEFPPPPTTTTIPTTTTEAPERPDPRPREVPSVVGMALADASDLLDRAGFDVLSVPAPDGAGRPGRVVAQSPPPGDEAPRGSVVYVEVVPEPRDTSDPRDEVVDEPAEEDPVVPGIDSATDPGNGKAKGKDKPKKDER